MGEQTGISWTNHTFNPWWGCVRVSEACRNCYAEATDARYGGGDGHWGPEAPRRFFGDAHWREPLKWRDKAARAGTRARVFCGSMCDWAEDRAELAPHRARMFELVRETSDWLDWLLLTKRHERLPFVLPWYADGRQTADPWRNIWLGVTAEDQRCARERGMALRAVAAEVRFLSMEPLLEMIGEDTLDAILGPAAPGLGRVHWAIVGDESGGTAKSPARPCNVEWVRQIRDACTRHGVAFHLKQWAGRDAPPGIVNPYGDDRKGRKIHLPVLYDLEPDDGRSWAEFPRLTR